MPSITIAEKCGCGKMYVHVSHKEGVIKKVEMHLGKQGTCPRVLCDALTNSINTGLEYHVPLKRIISDLDNQSCQKKVPHKKGGTTRSCADCIAQALKEVEDEHLCCGEKAKRK